MSPYVFIRGRFAEVLINVCYVEMVQLRQGWHDIHHLHRLDQDEDAGGPWGSLVICDVYGSTEFPSHIVQRQQAD